MIKRNELREPMDFQMIFLILSHDLFRQGLAQQDLKNLNDADLHSEWKKHFDNKLTCLDIPQSAKKKKILEHFFKWSYHENLNFP